ncbi:hypothetical protein [Lusitaniella coriacea]|uniref:hypothetical protein n=1 Tax=Lusitaniella coriacea TaxID=1983105 RepID=UPI003CED44F9
MSPIETAPTLTSQHIQSFVTILCSLHWRLNFSQFCDLLEFDPNYSHAREKWERWQQLVVGLSAFDSESFDKLFSAYYHSNSSQLSSSESSVENPFSPTSYE